MSSRPPPVISVTGLARVCWRRRKTAIQIRIKTLPKSPAFLSIKVSLPACARLPKLGQGFAPVCSEL